MKNQQDKPSIRSLNFLFSLVHPQTLTKSLFYSRTVSHFITLLLLISTLIGVSSCGVLVDHGVTPEPQITPLATGLVAPLGLEVDTKGQVWVTEAGSGTANDGQLSLITPDGMVYPVVKGFSSLVSPEGAVFGLNQLLLQGNILWLLHGIEGRLYKLDISQFGPGSAPLRADQLEYEDIGTFVKGYAFDRDTDASDVFDLTAGPDGDLFIADAAANAIIRRKSITKELSVFATLPPIASGTDTLEAVPTGIVFDGQKFLVSNFTGYPYPAQKAPIYQVDLAGKTSVYQTGFSTLSGIELSADQAPIVLEYGTWTGQGFDEKSGTISRVTPQANTRLVSGLNFPNAIKRSGANTYYIAQTFDGTIQKVTL